MLDQGQPGGLEVFWPVEIYGQWHTLSATASAWAAESAAAAEQMEQAAGSWTGLVSSYREAETQEIVRTALDEAPGVTREWAGVVGRAADVLQSFATEANGLQQQATALEGQAARLQARLWASGLFSGVGGDEDTSAEDAALRGEIDVHNSDVMALNSRWQQLEQQTASEIDSIAGGGGYQDQIPLINTDGAAFGPPAGGLGPGGFGAGGSLAGGALVGGALAGGSLTGDGGLGLAFQSALAQMIRSGNDGPVETATELYETVTSDEVTGADVEAFYNQLGQMDADQIVEFAEANPQINHYSIPQPSSDEDLASWPTGEYGADWWNTLEDNGTQNAMLTALPLLTGNVRGVPPETRHKANLEALTVLRDSGRHSDYQDHLTSIEDSLTSRDASRGERFLLSLDVGTADEPARQPLAEVAVGNPEEASEVTYSVAGMNSSTANMTGEVERAQAIYEETTDQAVVAWMGYDPPTLGETFQEPVDFLWPEDDGLDGSTEGSVLSDARAEAGSYRFAYAIDAQRSAAGAGEVADQGINVVAHSYGTNMVSHALTLDGQQQAADKVIFIGSSGIPESVASSAADLNVGNTAEGKPAVFVTQADADWLATLGQGEWEGIPVTDAFFLDPPRLDPRDEEFDAYVFSSDVDQPFGFWHDDPDHESVTDHTRYDDDPDVYGYLDPETLSFETIMEMLNDGEGSVDFERVPTNGAG